MASLPREARIFIQSWSAVSASYFGVVTVLLNLYLVRLGYGPGFVGTVNGLGLFTMAIVAPPMGLLARRIGSGMGYLVGLAVLTLSGVLLPLAEWLPPGGPRSAGLLGSMAVTFAAGALMSSSMSPYFMEVLTEESRATGFALRAAFQTLAVVAGSLAAGLLPRLIAAFTGAALSSPAPYRLSLCTVPALYLLGLVRMLSIVRRPDRVASPSGAGPQSSAARSPAPLGVIFLLAGIGMLRGAGGWIASSFANVHMDRSFGASTAAIGSVAAVGRLVSIPTSLLMPHFRRRWGAAPTVVVSTIGMAFSLLGMALAARWTGVAAGWLAMLACTAVAATAGELFYQEHVEAEWRPLMAGVCTSASSVCSGALVLVGGILAQGVGYGCAFALGAAVTLVSAVAFGLAFMGGRLRRGRPRLAPSRSA